MSGFKFQVTRGQCEGTEYSDSVKNTTHYSVNVSRVFKEPKVLDTL